MFPSSVVRLPCRVYDSAYHFIYRSRLLSFFCAPSCIYFPLLLPISLSPFLSFSLSLFIYLLICLLIYLHTSYLFILRVYSYLFIIRLFATWLIIPSRTFLRLEPFSLFPSSLMFLFFYLHLHLFVLCFPCALCFPVLLIVVAPTCLYFLL